MLTSTKKDGGFSGLIDVFDMEGRYIDSFFLRFSNEFEARFIADCILHEDNHLFIIEQNKDGFFCVNKYKLVNE